MTDAKASDKVDDRSTFPDAANVPATYAGVVVKASPNQAAAPGVPRLARGPRRPGDPRRVRVPAAAVDDRRRRRRDRRARGLARAATARDRLGRRSSLVLAGLFALFLALPVVDARRPGDPRRLAASTPPASPVVLAALAAEPRDDRGQPRADRRARAAARVRPRPAHVPRQVARRGASSTCRSCCRRRSPGSRLLLVFGRRGLLGAPLSSRRASTSPFTTSAVILAQTFVSAPFFVRSARARVSPASTATSRTPPGSTARRSASCSGRSPCRSPARRSPPAS